MSQPGAFSNGTTAGHWALGGGIGTRGGIDTRNGIRTRTDSIAWAAAQPWSNGAVGMEGSAYHGAVQLFAAAQAPPALRAIVPRLVTAPA